MKSCGFRYAEEMQISAHILTRNGHYSIPKYEHENLYDHSSVSSRYLHTPWQDEVNFVKLVVEERVRLEVARVKSESYFVDVKYHPPPEKRVTMLTRKKESTSVHIKALLL